MSFQFARSVGTRGSDTRLSACAAVRTELWGWQPCNYDRWKHAGSTHATCSLCPRFMLEIARRSGLRVFVPQAWRAGCCPLQDWCALLQATAHTAAAPSTLILLQLHPVRPRSSICRCRHSRLIHSAFSAEAAGEPAADQCCSAGGISGPSEAPDIDSWPAYSGVNSIPYVHCCIPGRLSGS